MLQLKTIRTPLGHRTYFFVDGALIEERALREALGLEQLLQLPEPWDVPADGRIVEFALFAKT